MRAPEPLSIVQYKLDEYCSVYINNETCYKHVCLTYSEIGAIVSVLPQPFWYATLKALLMTAVPEQK